MLSRCGVVFWLRIPKVRHVVERLAFSCVDRDGRRELDALRRRLLEIIHGTFELNVSLERNSLRSTHNELEYVRLAYG